MAYETGTSTGPSDLLDKLRVFLVAQGWTVNGWADDTYNYSTPSGIDGTGKRLHVQKNAADGTVMYFNFRSAIRGLVVSNSFATSMSGRYYGELTGIAVNGSTGYNGSSHWDQQPGAPAFANGVVELSTVAIPSYHFFADGDTVNVVVEYGAGKYQFLSFGCLEKQGAYTGGQFFSGSFASDQFYRNWTVSGWYVPHYFTNTDSAGGISGSVYVNVDGTASWRKADSTTKEIVMPCVAGQRANATYMRGGLCNFFWSKSPNFYNGLAAMGVLYVLLKRSDGNYSLLGWPKNIRSLNIVNYAAGQELTYGSETWLVFPASLEDETQTLNKNVGFAYKKVV